MNNDMKALVFRRLPLLDQHSQSAIEHVELLLDLLLRLGDPPHLVGPGVQGEDVVVVALVGEFIELEKVIKVTRDIKLVVR